MAFRFSFRRSTMAAALLTALPHLADSQSPPLRVEVATLASGTFFLADPPASFAILRQGAVPVIVQGSELRHAPGVGVTAGVRLIGDFGVEGMFSWAPVRLRATGGLESQGQAADMNTLTYGVTFLYHLTRLARFEPFAGVGFGAETFSYDPQLAWERRTELASNALAGLHVWLGERISLRMEARHFLVPFGSEIEGVEGRTLNDLVFSAGLSFSAQR
jgi:hypothetical protein